MLPCLARVVDSTLRPGRGRTAQLPLVTRAFPTHYLYGELCILCRARISRSLRMAKHRKQSARLGQIQAAVLGGIFRASEHLTVDADDFLERIQRSHDLSIRSFRDMFFVPQEEVDYIADRTISAAIKLAAIEGTGLGAGGFATVIPDLGILAVICMRMIQKLSLVYGFECATEEETAELWIAAASAAGISLGRDFLEKEVLERFAPRVMERIAARMGAEVAEKWAARMIPVVSGAIGGALNYYFVRAWGRRAKRHFRERHIRMRERLEPGPGNVSVPMPRLIG
jgi:hypothetical protein